MMWLNRFNYRLKYSKRFGEINTVKFVPSSPYEIFYTGVWEIFVQLYRKFLYKCLEDF